MEEAAASEAPVKRSKKQKRKERVARHIEEAEMDHATPIIMPGQWVNSAAQTSTKPTPRSSRHVSMIRDAPPSALALQSKRKVSEPNVGRQPARSTPLTVAGEADKPTKKTRGPAKATPTAQKQLDEAWLSSGPIQPEENQEILTERWWSASDLTKMKTERGLKFITGKFREEEAQRIAKHLDTFKKVNCLNDEELRTILFAKKLQRVEHGPFWKELAKAVPFRPIKAVCQYVQRQWHPYARKGPWTKEEDDALIAARMTMGNSWNKIGEAIERSGSDCIDRWKNHLQHRDTAKSGPWSPEEEQELVNIIKEQYGGSSTDPEDWVRGEKAWSAISAKMGHRRTREQIMGKWSENLARRQVGSSKATRWSAYDAGQLVARLLRSDAQSEGAIDWTSLSDGQWNLWSSKKLHRRFQNLRAQISKDADLHFRELLAVLAKKYPEIDPVVHANQPGVSERSTKSKDFIEDSDEEAGDTPVRHAETQTPQSSLARGNDVATEEANARVLLLRQEKKESRQNRIEAAFGAATSDAVQRGEPSDKAKERSSKKSKEKAIDAGASAKAPSTTRKSKKRKATGGENLEERDAVQADDAVAAEKFEKHKVTGVETAEPFSADGEAPLQPQPIATKARKSKKRKSGDEARGDEVGAEA